MFTDGVDEFFKCFMESINAVLINENQDKNVCLLDIVYSNELFGLSLTKSNLILENINNSHIGKGIRHEQFLVDHTAQLL